MTRSVNERDAVVAHLRLIGADVLGDPACLTGDHVGAANTIEQLGLAVIDVTHDRDHRRSTGKFGLVIGELRLGRIAGASGSGSLAAAATTVMS